MRIFLFTLIEDEDFQIIFSETADPAHSKGFYDVLSKYLEGRDMAYSVTEDAADLTFGKPVFSQAYLEQPWQRMPREMVPAPIFSLGLFDQKEGEKNIGVDDG